MASLLLHYRYFLFGEFPAGKMILPNLIRPIPGAFIVCNAIICSVAAWNFSLARDTGIDRMWPVSYRLVWILTPYYRTVQIDVFLIFLGIFGVAFLLPV